VEKRVKDRAKKRLMVKYGLDKADRTAFTKNVSEAGMNLKTNHVFKPGSTLMLEVHMPDKVFSLWARVAWAKKVPPQLAHVLDCGMGLSFVEVPPEWNAYFKQWQQG
jgi:Tfp pilus assembly protein PilZ